ncbi:helix-turn-helix domain-containing protein [Ahrensia sp. 13_GOM-1096m]|uniref:helix-turn-helix domain-containing protein n=1 Tax=Ahrensia sp. 13_GOM-1096m TaxID=1380380 RepID=UPI00047CCEB4|nr:helix-turn-helix domain-containing protein [Ahrensia sp. 13_GOM-1096m]
MKLLDIGDVCRLTGLRPSAVRYYEELGLISSVCRNGLRRQFSPEIVTQLALISMGKSAGFDLTEISEMFGSDGRPDIPRETLHKKANDLDWQIIELKAIRDLVRHAAECSAPSHMECPTFRRLVELAMRGKKITKSHKK